MSGWAGHAGGKGCRGTGVREKKRGQEGVAEICFAVASGLGGKRGTGQRNPGTATPKTGCGE